MNQHYVKRSNTLGVSSAKKLLLILIGLSGSVFAENCVFESYTFNMNVNQLSQSVDDGSSCSQSTAEALQQDIAADPQQIVLHGSYDICKGTGAYHTINYQNLDADEQTLHPLGLEDYEFGNWYKKTTQTEDGQSAVTYEQVTINGHTYPLYGITFSVDRKHIDEETWGTNGVLELLIPDTNTENGVCLLTSSPQATSLSHK